MLIQFPKIKIRPQEDVQDSPAVVTMESLFKMPAELLATETAQLARTRGLLLAKREAHKTADNLVKYGTPLKALVILVSFFHLWHEISRIVPSYVAPFRLPDAIYHFSSAALIGAIDLVALYLVSSRQTLAYIGERRQTRGVLFFYTLTAILNGVFILSYMPGLPDWFTAVLPLARMVAAVMLAILVPVAIAAVEQAHQHNEVARLSLMVDIETLAGILPAAEAALSTSALTGAESLPLILRDCPKCGKPSEVEDTPAYLGAFGKHGCQVCRDKRKAPIPHQDG